MWDRCKPSRELPLCAELMLSLCRAWYVLFWYCAIILYFILSIYFSIFTQTFLRIASFMRICEVSIKTAMIFMYIHTDMMDFLKTFLCG